MIKLSELLKAVNTRLKETFPSISIDSKDLSEAFNRPSFRTELDGLKTSAFMTTFKERNFTIRIYFFCTKIGQGRLERLKISDEIENFKEYKLNNLYMQDGICYSVYEKGQNLLILGFDPTNSKVVLITIR